jgi:uncharacterized metal-binding protein
MGWKKIGIASCIGLLYGQNFYYKWLQKQPVIKVPTE